MAASLQKEGVLATFMNSFLVELSASERLETPEETRNISSTQVRRLVREIREKREELERLAPPEILSLLDMRTDTEQKKGGLT